MDFPPGTTATYRNSPLANSESPPHPCKLGPLPGV